MLFYRTTYGGLICSDDVETDFHFHTGKHRYEDECGYLRHLHKMLGALITEVILPPEEWSGKSRVEVIKMYRDEHPEWSLLKCRNFMEDCIRHLKSQ